MEMSNVIQNLIISVPPLVLAITFHEVSHGYIAYRLGDPTAKLMGRLTLNPIKHIDPVGTVILPLILSALGGVIFGYAKPVPINPSNFNDPKKGMAISAAAGPITNVILAILSALLLVLVIKPIASVFNSNFVYAVFNPLILMFKFSITINLFLAALNLMPILPLDGGRVLVGFLPYKQAVSYSKLEPYGLIILFALIFTRIAGYFIFPLFALLSKFVPFFDKIFSF